MKSLSTRTRITLAGLASVLIVTEIYWFGRTEPAPVPEFELKATPIGVSLYRLDPANIPLFDPAKERWTVKGSEIESPPPMRVHELANGIVEQPIERDYFVVSLPSHPTPAIFRQALISLSNKGICYFAVYDEMDKGPNQDKPGAPIYEIKSVKNGKGELVACHPAFAFVPELLRKL